MGLGPGTCDASHVMLVGHMSLNRRVTVQKLGVIAFRANIEAGKRKDFPFGFSFRLLSKSHRLLSRQPMAVVSGKRRIPFLDFLRSISFPPSRLVYSMPWWGGGLLVFSFFGEIVGDVVGL